MLALHTLALSPKVVLLLFSTLRHKPSLLFKSRVRVATYIVAAASLLGRVSLEYSTPGPSVQLAHSGPERGGECGGWWSGKGGGGGAGGEGWWAKSWGGGGGGGVVLDRVHGAVGQSRGRDSVVARDAREARRTVGADPDLDLIEVAGLAVEGDAPLARLVEAVDVSTTRQNLLWACLPTRFEARAP